MSQTTTQFDLKQNLIERIEQSAQLLENDLKHIPAEKLNVSPMGCAKTPLAIVAECGGLNQLAAEIIRGGSPEMPGDDELKGMMAQFDDLDKAIKFLHRGTRELVSALQELDDERLHEEAFAPWGEPTTFFRFANLCTIHMMYHDGQMNYIQCLYGDDKMHWHEH
jgi:hypothetical protein